jgi:uncharacterized membrane protein YccC
VRAVDNEALAGQLRAASELAVSSTQAGRVAFERRQLARPWRLRAESTMAALRANLTLRSSAMRHAIRLSVAAIAGELIGHAAGGSRAYWLPMTAAIVLKPDFAATFSRGLLRIFGTLAGLGAATVLFHVVTPTAALEVALISAIVFILRCFGAAHYGVLTAALSAYIVLLFALAGQSPREVIAERALHTLLGGALALLLYTIWPTWERTRIREQIADMFEAYRLYFQAVHERRRDLDEFRSEGRLARSNVEAAIDRFSAEPRSDPEIMAAISKIMASSHRVIFAMMAIEAGLTEVTREFTDFAYKVEITLHSLAGSMRGFRLDPETLPDLRAAHHALAESGSNLTAEADRLTNSLNTLAEHVLACRQEDSPAGRAFAN